MARFLLALALLFPSAAALAIQWPWQDPPETRAEYCRGFLARSLGSFPVEGLSRVQLWLAWNEVVKLTPIPFDPQGREAVEGREFFDAMLQSGDTGAIVDQASGACALGTG